MNVWPNVVLLSMFVVLPVAAIASVGAAVWRSRVRRAARIGLPVLAGVGVVGLVAWLVIRLSAFGYWMSGAGPEPDRLEVARTIGVVVAVLAWVCLVGAAVALLDGLRRSQRPPAPDPR